MLYFQFCQPLGAGDIVLKFIIIITIFSVLETFYDLTFFSQGYLRTYNSCL